MEWYTSDNNLRGTPHGSQKKSNVERSPTWCLWTADANSHMPCHAHAVLCRGLKKLLSEWQGHGMAQVRHGMCESNTVTLCKSNGKDTIYTLSGTAWQGNGMGTVWEWHGHGMGMAWARYGNGMGTVWERHGMCELALRRPALSHTVSYYKTNSSYLFHPASVMIYSEVWGQRPGWYLHFCILFTIMK
jgi:hypothetical protein